MTSKVGKRPLRSLSAHEKMEAIRRVHDGESKASVARDIGVPESTLRGWCKNEDKILYLSRQSTPDTDESDHLQPREKKPRYDDISTLQPYNLSVRGASNSPPPTIVPVVVEAVDTTEVEPPLPAALNLTKQDSPKTASMITPTSTLSAADRERERNRAELARLSVELGLNRPEMFLPNANLAANLSDLSTLTANLGLVAQWNSALLQQVTASANTSTTNPKKRTSSSTAIVDTTSSQLPAIPPPVVTTTIPTTTNAPPVPHHHNNNNNNNTINKTSQKVKKTSQQQVDTSSVDDSVWYWLKTQQAMLGLVGNPGQNNVDPNSSWFWKWYKQLAYSQQFPQNAPQQVNIAPTTPEKPILYQQLTKDTNIENQLKNEETPKSTKTNTKVRAVLDNLLLNNNNNDDASPVNVVDDVTKEEKPEESTPSSAAEALCHGELFLKWLEKCGDPSVTAVQVLQFRYLLNNVRTGADRKNGAENMKTKVRSRK